MAVTGVYTNAYRAKLAELANNIVGAANVDAPAMRLGTFRFGEGGYEVILGSPVPKTPSRTLTDIEAQGYGVNALYYWEGTLADGGAGVLTVACQIPAGDGNDRGDATSPTFYEVGLYDEAGVMMIYVTFDGEIKTALKTLTLNLTVTH